MNLWQLVDRNLRQRPLSSALTVLSVALGVMLVSAILVVRDELERTYEKQGQGYSLVVGPAGGSPLELVLNAVYHAGTSAGLLPWSVQEELASDSQARYVRVAVPYAVGDSFRGHRVVATTEGLFSKWFPFPAGATPESKLAKGRPFRCSPTVLADVLSHVKVGDFEALHADPHDHDHNGDDHAHHDHGVFEAVLGAAVAESLDLDIGARIEPTHGVEGEQQHKHEQLWTVTGILKKTGTPIDQVVFINLDSFYRIADHAGGRIPVTGEPAISSILLFPRKGYAKPQLLNTLMKRSDLQVAEVATQINRLLSIVGRVDTIFLVVAILTVIVGVLSIMVAIYNTMNERRRELAIMRAIGARRTTLLAVIVLEAAALAFSGAVIGLVLGHLLIYAAADHVA
ncbi:MAG: ABC transporter permease, partial [Planctomycetes bacterium]|nr:ABC transporter permease [Planctomycetota bacterium]